MPPLPRLPPRWGPRRADVQRRSPSLSASAASCLLLAPLRFPAGPPGELGAAASPPAMASANVSRTLSLQGDGASVPAGGEDAQQTASGRPSLPTRPASGRAACSLRSRCSEQPSRTPGAGGALPGCKRRGRARTRAHLPAPPAPPARPRTGCGSRPRCRAAPARSPPWPRGPAEPAGVAADTEVPAPTAARRSRPRRPGAANVQSACPAALSHWSVGRAGRGRAARAGRAGPSPGLESERQVPRARYWSTRLPVWGRGRGVGGALRAGRPGKKWFRGPNEKSQGSWTARCGDAGAGSGRVSGIGGPDGAARLQVGPRVAGGGLTTGTHPEPLSPSYAGGGGVRGGEVGSGVCMEGGGEGELHPCTQRPPAACTRLLCAAPGCKGRSSPSPWPPPHSGKGPCRAFLISWEGAVGVGWRAGLSPKACVWPGLWTAPRPSNTGSPHLNHIPPPPPSCHSPTGSGVRVVRSPVDAGT